MKTVIAIDPGTHKCGIAAVTKTRVLYKTVVKRTDAPAVIVKLAAEHSADEIIIGNGTGSEALFGKITLLLSMPIRIVDEAHSTRRAKSLYFDENPPRGLKRLIPRGLLTPDRPYDDYIAVLLAKEYLDRSPEP